MIYFFDSLLSHISVHLSGRLCACGGAHGDSNLDGVGGDLDLVQLPHGAVAVDEVGGGQLVEGLHILGGVDQLPVQLGLGHVHGQRLLSCREHRTRAYGHGSLSLSGLL